MSAQYKFQGWLGHDPKSANGNMKWELYEPKLVDVDSSLPIP